MERTGSLAAYELLQLIGKGSYGKVYTARSHEDSALYVIKRIPISDSADEAEAAVREAHVLACLRHPHIVPYKEFFNDSGDLCLVMAHCEGGDLFQHIKQQKRDGQAMDEEQAWLWMVQLLLALSYCHSKRILHRDVKTQNVFLTADGKLMLGDFGLAKQLQRTLEMARTPIGTPYYMAPEIYEEEPYSFKSDVWALGCVMYELLTGRPAFAAENLSRVVIKVLKGLFDPLPETYSVELRTLIASMLLKDVKRRPTANDLLQVRQTGLLFFFYEQSSLCGAGCREGRLDHFFTRSLSPRDHSVFVVRILWLALRLLLCAVDTNQAVVLRLVVVVCEHPLVVKKVEAYLNSLSAVGSSQAGWRSTWRMKLPPTVLAQMAQIVAQAERLRPPSAGPKPPLATQERADTVVGHSLTANGRNGAAAPALGGEVSELELLSVQVADVVSHRTAALQDEDNYLSDFEEEEEEEEGGAEKTVRRPDGLGPAAQLLGMTQGPLVGTARTNRTARSGSATLRDSALSACTGSPDEGLLSSGLPTAGFGFRDTLPYAAAPAASARGSDDGRPSSAWHLAPLPGGAYGGPGSLPPLANMPSFSFPAPSKLDSPAGLPPWRRGAVRDPRTTASGQLSLNVALTNRAAVLRRELELQLGGEAKLQAACDAVRALPGSSVGGRGDGELREALTGLVSPAHLELAPLLDELVLLQDRFYGS